MDRRQQKTQDAIFAAFTELLAHKTYSKITVNEIIAQANIGRSTFYAHFETKDDLLRKMCGDLFAHVFTGSNCAEPSHNFAHAPKNSEEIITHILYHLRDHKKNILGILSCDSGDLFLRFFKEYIDKLTTVYLLPRRRLSVSSLPEDFLINHISSSFVGTVQWWIKNHLVQTPEQLAHYFMLVIKPVLA